MGFASSSTNSYALSCWELIRNRGLGVTDQKESTAEKDWGNLRFRRRRSRYADGMPDDNANNRFVIGLVVFVLVALLYP